MSQSTEQPSDSHSTINGWVLLSLGVLLMVLLFAIRLVASYFQPDTVPSTAAVTAFVVMLIAAGAVFLGVYTVVRRTRCSRWVLLTAFVIGLAMRTLFFGSHAIYEDDWHRYLWDGAVLAEGVNPYTYPPADAQLYSLLGEAIELSEEEPLRRLQMLGRDYPDTLYRVNYPYVSTIYPPLTQGAFLLAHIISPFNLDAWRLVLLLVDVFAWMFLVYALKTSGRSSLWGLLYWWNPLVVVTTYNAGHMDVLMVPALLAAYTWAYQRKVWKAAIALAVAVGVKFWPLVLVPVLFRQERKQRLVYLAAAGLVGIISVALILPMMLSIQAEHSGLFAYASSWLRNAFLFPLLSRGMELWVSDGDLYARLLVAGAVSGVSLYLGILAKRDRDKLAASLLTVTALLFFLSPTGYPWYATWIFVFLPLAPSLGLSALVVSLPIYYLRFSLHEVGLESFFVNVLVPIEFLIPLVILGIEQFRKRGAQSLFLANGAG